MTPVQCAGLRHHAQRSVWLDFKYGTMSTFNVKFALQWFERVQDLNPSRQHHYKTFYQSLIQDYNNLEQNRVTYLAGKYDIDYGIFEKPKELDFPVVYQNEKYVMYQLG